jgi:hypothetical protein
MHQVTFATGTAEVFAGGLLAAIDVGGGPSDEQLCVLRALVAHVWHDSDVDLRAVSPLSPREVADRLADTGDRLRFSEMAIVLELCRHPLSLAQVARVETYVGELGVGGIELRSVRQAIEQGAAAAAEDLERSYREILPEVSELQLRDRALTLAAPDPELAARLRALHELPEGTLGRGYMDYYDRHGFGIPGEDLHLPAHYVNHDMNHVITGYAPTAPGEVARSGFLWSAEPSRHNWLEFLLSMSIHESGVVNHGEIRAKLATLERQGSAEQLGEALDRGQQCTVDLPGVDHLAIAAEPLDSIRERFNVVPFADGSVTHDA